MTLALRFAAALSAFTFAALPMAQAQSLKQRELIAEDKKQVAERLARANQTCGSDVKLTTDYNTFSDVTTSPDNPNQQSPWAFIANATDAMDTLCRGSDEGKTAIQQKLKVIQVSHAKEQSLKFTNGTLNYAVTYNHSNVETIVKFLKDNL